MPYPQMKYFVIDGEMHSGWVLASVDLDVTNDQTDNRYVYELLVDDPLPSKQLQNHIDQLIERPGRWCLMSGRKLVHLNDVYDTREAAADAYKQYLLANG